MRGYGFKIKPRFQRMRDLSVFAVFADGAPKHFGGLEVVVFETARPSSKSFDPR